jgi:hypothetical protein
MCEGSESQTLADDVRHAAESQFVHALGDYGDLVISIAEGVTEVLDDALHAADRGPILAGYECDAHPANPTQISPPHMIGAPCVA